MPAHHHFAVTVLACFILFIFSWWLSQGKSTKGAFSSVLHFFMWPRSGTGDQESLQNFTTGGFEVGLSSGAGVGSLTKELPRTLMLWLMRSTAPPRAARCSPSPQGLGGSDPPRQPGSSRPLAQCAVLSGARRARGCQSRCPSSLSFFPFLYA